MSSGDFVRPPGRRCSSASSRFGKMNEGNKYWGNDNRIEATNGITAPPRSLWRVNVVYAINQISPESCVDQQHFGWERGIARRYCSISWPSTVHQLASVALKDSQPLTIVKKLLLLSIQGLPIQKESRCQQNEWKTGEWKERYSTE